MSMSLYILSDGKLSSMGAWQQAIDTEGFPIRLPLRLPMSQAIGVLAIKYRDQGTAFEYRPRAAGDVMTEMKHIDFGRRWKFAFELIWGGDVNAGISAFAAAAAYARATGGVVLDCEQGKIISAQQAATIAIDLEKGIPMIEAAVRKVMEQFKK